MLVLIQNSCICQVIKRQPLFSLSCCSILIYSQMVFRRLRMHFVCFLLLSLWKDTEQLLERCLVCWILYSVVWPWISLHDTSYYTFLTELPSVLLFNLVWIGDMNSSVRIHRWQCPFAVMLMNVRMSHAMHFAYRTTCEKLKTKDFFRFFFGMLNSYIHWLPFSLKGMGKIPCQLPLYVLLFVLTWVYFFTYAILSFFFLEPLNARDSCVSSH